MSEKSAKEKTVSTQYVELNRFSANGEYERALKAANKILGVAPEEFLAFHCKIVCHIHLSKFEECLSLINKNPQFASQLIFEKAYCYYRLNQPTEALKTIQQASEADYRMKELQAQVYYRLENFPEAVSLYKEIIENTNDDDYEDERYTNLSAAQVFCSENNENDITVPENTYELCYNNACLLIAKGLYAEAEKKLKLCEKLCREVLEDEDMSEEEIDLDLALIRIQLAFVCQKLGRIKEAHQLYIANLKMKLEDIALIAVASNNTVCINRDQNLFDSKKKMKAAVNPALLHKLPSLQRKYIALNNAILHYYINQNDICIKLCDNISNIWPELSIYTIVLKSLVFIKTDKRQEALALLKKFKSDNKSDELYIKLCITQIHLMEGEKLEACKVLQDLGENSYKPGIVGALTTLYLGLGDEDTALKIFENTVDWYKKNKVKKIDLTNIWRQAADFHIKNGHPQVAANSLEELLKTNQDDKRVTAQLILALAQFDKERALSLRHHLPSIEEISKEVDIESLENTSSTALNVKKSPSIKQESQPGTPRSEGILERKRKHKKRKGKLPKNYNADVPPDPERWLPKYERSGYRKKRDRRMKEAIKGSQGTASSQADQYDFSKHVEQEPQESPNIEPSPKLKTQPHKKNPKKKSKRR